MNKKILKKLTGHGLIIILLSCFYGISYSQNIHINGAITGIDDAPLSNASIKVVGLNKTVIADGQGNFSIDVTPGSSLEFSSIGYFNKTVKVTSSTYLNIKLTENVNTAKLSEVVVVGYGKQKAPTVTGAVGVISGDDLIQTPVANITNMLVGRTSGISSVQSGGEPGQNATSIHIRGVATLNGADPLIVIDGIQQPAEQPFVVLNAMDPNEIESISILKDASATAVYGIRGANGVIIVTTKRGVKNRPQFSFSVNSGFTNATSLFQTINSYDFATLRNEAVANAQAVGNHSLDNLVFTDDELWKFKNNRDYTPEEVKAMNLTEAQKTQLLNSPALYYTSHNYYKEQFGGTGGQQQVNLNVSGGTDKIKYFTSLGYFHQTGILTNTSYGGANNNSNFQRYNFRSNFDINVIKNVQITFNIAGQSSVALYPNANWNGSDLGNRYQNIIQTILEGSPFMGPGIVDGHLVTSFVGNAGDSTNPLGLMGGGGNSPISQLLTSGTRTYYTTTLTNNLTIRHTMDYLTKGLSSHFSVAYDDSYRKGYSRTNSIPQYSAVRDPNDPNNIIFIGGQINPSSTSDNVDNGSWRKVYLEAAINYERDFGPHSVTGLVLGNAQRYTANGMTDNVPSGLMGLVGRATYYYKEKYLAEFNIGVNGTEQFSPGKRFGYFPAVSAGWILSKESFFPENKWVTWVKFRGSYGEVGSDQLGGRRYLYLPNTWAYNSGSGYWYGNSNGSSANPYFSGAAESALGNPNVTWERAKKTNVSVDLRFINDKLSLTGSVFQEKRNNILVTLGTIPSTYGVASGNIPPANVGKVSNKGVEIEAGWNDKIGSVTYFLKGNFSFARNKIDYMAEAPFPYPWMNRTGYSIGQYKGLLTNGFYNTPEELNDRPFNTYNNNVAQLGDLRYVDINGDGLIDQSDMVPIGYPNLPQIAYNFTAGFSYKGFDINALFIGTAKGSFSYTQNGYILSTPFAKNVGEVLQSAFDGHWTQEKYENGEVVTYPALALGSGVGQDNNLNSDFWLKSNSFIRLKNLEIGYTFSGNNGFMKSARIKGFRIYANGNNLLTWGTHLDPGIDPELADNGKNAMGYLFPITRTFNIGANIRF